MALQRLVRTNYCLAIDSSRSLVLNNNGRVLSHVDFSDNQKADRLAFEAHHLSPGIQALYGLRRYSRTVRQHFTTLAPTVRLIVHRVTPTTSRGKRHLKAVPRYCTVQRQLCFFEFGHTVHTRDLSFTIWDEGRQQLALFAGLTKTSSTSSGGVLVFTVQDGVCFPLLPGTTSVSKTLWALLTYRALAIAV